MKLLLINTEKGWRGGEEQTFLLLKGFNQTPSVNAELVAFQNSPLGKRAITEGYKVYSINNHIKLLLFLIFNGKNYNALLPQTGKTLTYSAFTKFFHRTAVYYTRRVLYPVKGFFSTLKYRLCAGGFAVSRAVAEPLRNLGLQNIAVVPDAFDEFDLYPPKIFPLSRKIKNQYNIFINKKFIHKNKIIRKKTAVLIRRNTARLIIQYGSAPFISKSIKKKHAFNSPLFRKLKIIATVAALTPEKDPFTAVETVKRLAGKRNDFIFLHFGEGYLENELKIKIKEYKLTAVYYLAGFRSDLENYFPFFNAFLMSSRSEGMGSVVLRAFASFTPVVTTAAGGLAEIVSGRGAVCPIGAAGALADALNAALNNPTTLQAQTLAANRYLKETHGLRSVIDAYLVHIQRA